MERIVTLQIRLHTLCAIYSRIVTIDDSNSYKRDMRLYDITKWLAALLRNGRKSIELQL